MACKTHFLFTLFGVGSGKPLLRVALTDDATHTATFFLSSQSTAFQARLKHAHFSVTNALSNPTPSPKRSERIIKRVHL
eukprot:3675404-Amphidinium_carterae.2